MIYFIVAVFAIVRFLVPSVPLDSSVTGIYKDLAHILVGGIIGAAIVTHLKKWVILAVLFTAVEVAAFFIRS